MGELVTSLEGIAEDLRDGSVVTIGNFDGVHVGHQAIIGRACSLAKQLSVPAIGLTFDPHPIAFFRPNAAPVRLTTNAQRFDLMASAGLDRVVALPFDKTLAAQSPEQFVEEILIEGLKARHVVVGQDFRFGARRAGDAETLQRLGAPHGMDATASDWLTFDGEPVSSTRIRNAVQAGELVDARQLLGRPYRLRGKIVSGEARGRTIGYPTANLEPEPMAMPPDGIYVTTLARLGGPRWKAATSIGHNPTFGENARTVETFVFDEAAPDDLDLYGADVELEVLQYLRDEARFDSVEALVAQMDRDVAAARRFFQ